MSLETVRIATRKSPLALWQAEEVARRLRHRQPDLPVEFVKMTTQGDQLLDSPLGQVGGKGLFVKELEQGILASRADLAVHSMKDVPMELPEGLHLPVILAREDPYDALVSNRYDSIEALPHNARIGTSSLRRQCQLRAVHPSFEVLTLRGNVNTRLAKLDRDEFDAIILAAAGLKRLGLGERITQRLGPEESLPAIGQGAIGVECRRHDERVLDLIRPLQDEATHTRVTAERAINVRLNGGCQLPIAGFAELDAGRLGLRALIGHPDGHGVLRAADHGLATEAESLGTRVAESLLAQGAGEILAELGIEPRPL